MDQTTTVPPRTGGVPTNGMTTGEAAGDAGADDLAKRLDALLQQRMQPQIEQAASAFRSIADRNVSKVEQRFQQQLAPMQQQLSEIQGYFQRAQEADLDPDERNRREQQRQQQSYSDQLRQSQIAAHVLAARDRVHEAIAGLGIRFGDPRVNWEDDAYEGARQGTSDPYAWATAVIGNATQFYAQQLQEGQRREREMSDTTARQRETELRQLNQVQQDNARRSGAVGQTSRAVPGGDGQMDVYDWLKQLPPKDYADAVDNLKRQVLRGGVQHPSQFTLPR